MCLLNNLFDYLGIFYIDVYAKKGDKFQFKHNKNKKYRQIICSLLKTGIEVDITYFNYVAYPLDNNTIEILVLTDIFGNGRAISILGII